MPCAINVVTDEPGRTVMEMTLKEGKNREIRRMCETVGLEVVRLKRNAGVVKLGFDIIKMPPEGGEGAVSSAGGHAFLRQASGT